MPGRMTRALLWAAVLALAAVIFAFSAQPGEASDSMTEAAVMPLAEMIASAANGDEESALQLFNLLGTLVRKTAHICEYALLSLLTALLLRCYGVKSRWLPFVLCVAYAMTDEVHQRFVPGRLGTPVDVAIDAIGVAIGVFVAEYVTKQWRKKHVHHP